MGNQCIWINTISNQHPNCCNSAHPNLKTLARCTGCEPARVPGCSKPKMIYLHIDGRRILSLELVIVSGSCLNILCRCIPFRSIPFISLIYRNFTLYAGFLHFENNGKCMKSLLSHGIPREPPYFLPLHPYWIQSACSLMVLEPPILKSLQKVWRDP